MVISCSAYGCRNRQGHRSSNGTTLKFHRFPLKEPKLLVQWITAVRRKSWLPTKTSFLCSEHFTDNDYRSTARRYLKDGAVPTNFNFSNGFSPRRRKQVTETPPKVTESSSDLVLSSELEKDMEIYVKQFRLPKHIGGCHCGAVKFCAIAPSKVKVYVCNCSICQMKQIKAFIVPKHMFTILQGRDNLTLYTFNTQIGKHYFCNICGVQSFYVPRSNPNEISVMVYCIDSKTIKEIEEIPFIGKHWEEANEKAPEIS